jgi:uncharacterized phiE125 gp8 family phage protein
MYDGVLVLKTAPTEEPITAAEIKINSRIDSETYGDSITETPSINIAEYSTGTQTGTGVDVSGAGNIVGLLAVGAVSSGVSASLVAHLEESDDDTTYTGVTGSTFTTVTTGNQNSVIEKAYTGTKQYLRVVGTNEGGKVIYGGLIQEKTPSWDEDTLINTNIAIARQRVEEVQNKSCLTQTWQYYLDEFPDEDYILLPRPPLQEVSNITYTDEDGVVSTLSSGKYIVDNYSEPPRIMLKNGESWPSFIEQEVNAVCVEYIAGSTSVAKFKERNYNAYQWIRAAVGYLNENRENQIQDFKTTALMEKRNWGFK